MNKAEALVLPDDWRERWLPVALSVLVHGLIALLLGWSWWHFRRPPPGPQALAIEGHLVNAVATATAPGAGQATPTPPPPAPAASQAAPVPPRPEPAPPPPPVLKPAPPPAVDPSLAERQRAAQQAARAQAAREQAAHEQAAREQAAREQAARERAAAEEAERKAREAAELARRQAVEKAAREAAERQAQENARRESDLRAQLASEERVLAARGSAEAAAYRSLIQARIQRNWIRPAGAQPGIECEVRVTQVPGGDVTGVQITRCNGDQALRESIEAAVYRASPLPVPSNPDLFDRNLVLTFHPDN